MTLERLTRTAALLADPVRLRLLCMLAHGELHACQAAAALRRPVEVVRRQLARLEGGGLVESAPSPHFTWTRWLLRTPDQVLSAMLAAAHEDPAIFDDVRRADGLRRVGPAALCLVQIDAALDGTQRPGVPGTLPCGGEHPTG